MLITLIFVALKTNITNSILLTKNKASMNMKKHFLLLASLVLGLGQLFADEVTFTFGDLKNTTPSITSPPYTWKIAPYHVSTTIDGNTLTIGTTTTIPANTTLTISAAGEGTLDGITFLTSNNHASKLTADCGDYSYNGNNGTWTPSGTTSSVTFTTTAQCRMVSYTVSYTPDENYTPDQPESNTIEATPIDNLASYTGSDPYVYDQKTMKYYALNSNNEYEEYGIITEVNALKVSGDAVTEIEYIKTNTSMGVVPYIKLNYIPKKNSRAVATLSAAPGNGQWKAAYGCGYDKGGWTDRFCLFTSTSFDSKAAINLGGETIDNSNAMRFGEKIVTVLDAAAGTLDIYEADGETLIGTITDSPKDADCKTPLYVFAQNKDYPDGSYTQTDCMNPFLTLYGLTLYEGETLIMDLVPAINGEGKGGLKDKLTGTFYAAANDGEFELSPDGQALAGTAGIPVYEGKMVIYNNRQYEYTNGSFVDKGQMKYDPVPGIGIDYRNLSNWSYPDKVYDSTFGVNVFNEATGSNTLDPYEGQGGWEPLSFKLSGLEKDETYRVSFTYSGKAWSSWSSYTTLPFFVLDAENMPGDTFNDPGAALAHIALPNTATTDLPCSATFTAAHNYALMCVQFGVVADGSKGFAFSFNDITVKKRVCPAAYREITWADPVKYTPLAYIESNSAARENAFTLPYSPINATQIDTKFMVYDTSNGWCGIFCARNTYAGTGISLYMNGNNRAHFGYFTGSTTGAGDEFAPFSLNTDYEVTADVTKLVVNGTEYPTGNTVTNATTRNLSLFANPEWDNPMRGRFYYCTITEAGELQYDFRPVMRHDGVFGFYDKTSRVFVQPARGTLDGYGYALLEDQAYVTYNKDTRIVIVGTTAQYLPEVQNLDGATFTWTSADESIATVAADGTVTGKAAGKVTITATTDADQGWTASYELTVAEPDYARRDANGIGYAIVTGGNGWNDSPLSALMDNDATTKFGCSGSGDAWAIIVAEEPVAVQQYSFVTGADTYNYPARNPRSWKLEGSNDNQDWTIIDEHSVEDAYMVHSVNREEFVFTINGTDAYKFFKFSAGTGDGFQLGELWINAQAYNWGEPTETASTCTVQGKKVWECADSKTLKTEVLPLAAHTYVNGVCSACGAKISEPVLLANGQTNPYAIKFRHRDGVSNNEYENIEEGWNTADFDDSAWNELVMPIGTNNYDGGNRNGAQVNTIWYNEDNTYWFRRTFNVEDPSTIAELTVKAVHDDDYAVFVNGTKVRNKEGWTNGLGWDVINVDPALLVPGKNVLAVYVEQNFGGAYCDFSLEAQVAAPVTVTDAGYATFVAPFDVDFTGKEVSAFAAQTKDAYVHLEPVTTVPAGTAVVVKADEGTYAVPLTTDANLGAENDLVASDADVTTDGTQYVLAQTDEGVGFYNATGTIAAGKGYLVISAGIKAFYPFEKDNATGIDALEGTDNNEPVYNLSGQRIGKAQKGVNIIGGKKILK